MSSTTPRFARHADSTRAERRRSRSRLSIAAVSPFLFAMLIASGHAQTNADVTRKAPPVKADKRQEVCDVLPGKSGRIEDRCKQIGLQCGETWRRRHCGHLIRPVF